MWKIRWTLPATCMYCKDLVQFRDSKNNILWDKIPPGRDAGPRHHQDYLWIIPTSGNHPNCRESSLVISQWIQPPPFFLSNSQITKKTHSSSRFSGWWTPNSDDDPDRWSFCLFDKLMVLNMWVSMIKAGTVSKKKCEDEWVDFVSTKTHCTICNWRPSQLIRFPPYQYKNQPAIIVQSSSTVSRWANPLQAVKWTNMLNQKNNWNGPENICRNDWVEIIWDNDNKNHIF